jgi:hypothetical protein
LQLINAKSAVRFRDETPSSKKQQTVIFNPKSFKFHHDRNIVNDSLEPGFSREAGSRSTGQKIVTFYGTRKVFKCAQESANGPYKKSKVVPVLN